MSTVLPTPAPPNRPILPPLTYGVSRSMTLMPVSRISVLPSSWSKAGALRWMPHCSPSRPRPGTSRQSPRALNTWPLTTSPTGTEIALPVSRTGAPRTRPSVGCIEIVRTRLSPRCWATSRVSVLATASSVMSALRALNNSGTAPRGNSTSTTAPITRTTRPVRVVVAVALMSLITSCATGKRGGATDDLADLLGDLGLTGRVRLPAERFDQLFSVVRRGLHRRPPGGRLGSRRLQQSGEQPRLDVLRQQRAEERLGVRLEVV